MRNLRLVFLLAVVILPFSASSVPAEPMTWEEHREAAKAILRHRIADPVTPVQHLERALELARHEGVSPTDIGDLMDQLSNAHRTYGSPQEKSERLILDTLRYKEAFLGENSPELVPTLRQLSDLRFTQQRNLESLQLMARALSIQIRNFGVASSQAAEGYALLGLTLEAAGEVEQADTILRKAVEIVYNVPNPPDEIAFGVLANASEFLRRRGRIEESEALRRDSLPAMKRVLESDRLEAKDLEHLKRAPYPSDVRALSDQELAALVAAGFTQVEPAPGRLESPSQP